LIFRVIPYLETLENEADDDSVTARPSSAEHTEAESRRSNLLYRRLGK